MKEKALILSASQWSIDGQRGGKITYTTFQSASSAQKSGIEVISCAAPFETLSQLTAVPCIAELDLSVQAATVNGRAIAKLVVNGVQQLTGEKSLSSNCLKVTLQP